MSQLPRDLGQRSRSSGAEGPGEARGASIDWCQPAGDHLKLRPPGRTRVPAPYSCPQSVKAGMGFAALGARPGLPVVAHSADSARLVLNAAQGIPRYQSGRRNGSSEGCMAPAPVRCGAAARSTPRPAGEAVRCGPARTQGDHTSAIPVFAFATQRWRL